MPKGLILDSSSCPSKTIHTKILRTRCRQIRNDAENKSYDPCCHLKGENDMKFIHLPYSYREPTWLLELRVLELHDRNRASCSSSSVSAHSDDSPVTIVEPMFSTTPSMISFDETSSVTSSLYSTTESQSSYSSPYPPHALNRVGTSNDLLIDIDNNYSLNNASHCKKEKYHSSFDRNNQWGYFVDTVPE